MGLLHGDWLSRRRGAKMRRVPTEGSTQRTGEAAVSVHDVAAYILSKQSPMSAMKLQKLTYYCQAWSLVWDDRPMFPEPIQAWANGPVVPALWERHRGRFNLDRQWAIGDPGRLDEDARETVDVILRDYGDKSAQWLSDLTHAERPWAEARRGMAAGDRGSAEITQLALADYYSSL